ncbi:hypothetical protein OFC58_37010, partial [Escherichia coli]|nr:hypothetical protein [Escherichia coli]
HAAVANLLTCAVATTLAVEHGRGAAAAGAAPASSLLTWADVRAALLTGLRLSQLAVDSLHALFTLTSTDLLSFLAAVDALLD